MDQTSEPGHAHTHTACLKIIYNNKKTKKKTIFVVNIEKKILIDYYDSSRSLFNDTGIRFEIDLIIFFHFFPPNKILTN